MIHRLARWGGLALALTLLCPLSLGAQEVPDSIRIPRLAALGRLYNAVRFFHPALGYLGLDWDGQTARAAEAVYAADSREAYVDALNRLLEILHDPATRVVDRASEPAEPLNTRDEPLTSRWTEDSMLVVRFVARPGDNWLTVAGASLALEPQIRASRGVVLDLRETEVWTAEGILEYSLSQAAVTAALLPAAVDAPGERTRFHEGYPPDDAESGSAMYHQGWRVQAGPVLAGGDSAQNRRVIFLVAPNTPLPSLALAARVSGVGMVVGEGEESRALGGSVGRLLLGEALEVRLRLGELVAGNGANADAVDTVVAPAVGNFDPAMTTALDLLRRPEFRGRRGEPLPISASPIRPALDSVALPSLGRRLLALYRLWGVINYFHAYPELYRSPWDEQLTRFVPVFEAARDSVAYGLAVATLMTGTDDSHSFVIAPGLRAHFGRATPPFEAKIIENRPIVTRIIADTLAPGLLLGDEILSVDGEAIAAREARISPYLAASNAAVRNRDVLSHALRGPDSSVAVLRVRGAGGRIRTLSVPRRRSFWPLFDASLDAPVLKLLPGNIGYADLGRLPGEMVDSMFTLFRGTRAIIFDMRGYPLGTAWQIAPRLTDRDRVVAAHFRLRAAREPDGLQGREMSTFRSASDFDQILPASGGDTYRGRTVMLINEDTQSQAEHTGLFFRAANGTRFIGSQTAGANGDVSNVSLPGGILVYFTGLAVFHPDGRPLQQVGLVPDIRVTPTIAGIRAGRDEVLERALGYLRGSAARP